MGLLSLAQKAYNKETNYIAGSDNAESSAKTKSTDNKTNSQLQKTTPQPAAKTVKMVAEDKLEEKVDKIVTSQSSPKKQGKIKTFINDKIKVDKKLVELRKKCKNNGIKFDTVLKHLGIEFVIKKPEEQLQILAGIERGIDEHIANKKFIKDKNLDKDKAVAARAKSNIEAQTAGLDIDESDGKDIGNINKKLDKDFEKLSDEEKTKKLNEIVEEKVKEEESKYDNKIRKCKNRNEREKLIKNREKHIENARTKWFHDYAEAHSAKEAAKAVVIVAANGMNKAVDYVLNTRCNDSNEKIKTADEVMSVKYVTDLLKGYYDRGEVPPKKVLEDANRIIVAAKSYPGAKQFEAEFYELRLLLKKEGIPEYLTAEELTTMSVGIGLGISFNENMTTDQKAECLNIWDEHANEFPDDYTQVKNEYNESVKQYLEEHPEAKEGIEELYKKYKEEYGKTPDIAKAATKRAEGLIQNQNSGITPKDEQDVKFNSNDNNITENKNENKAIKNTTSAKDIAKSIKSGDYTITDAINQFHEKAFDAIFEDQDLFAKNKVIAKIYVNNFRKDLKKLLELSNFSSAIELIAQNISPIIKEDYARQVKLSGITREAIFGKDDENAAA